MAAKIEKLLDGIDSFGYRAQNFRFGYSVAFQNHLLVQALSEECEFSLLVPKAMHFFAINRIKAQ